MDRYTNEQLIRWYNASGFMGTPTNSDLYAHFAGQDTLYFWADGRKSSPLTLSMIDIDCHESGNAQSAKAFADWLKDNYFPNLYHEPSTHGKGRHGYFVLFKDGFGDVAVATSSSVSTRPSRSCSRSSWRPTPSTRSRTSRSRGRRTSSPGRRAQGDRSRP